MAIKENIQKAINRQINREIYSAYLYLAMQSYFDSVNLKGFANWMKIQVQEELSHAMKMYDYLFQRGGKVILQTIETPPAEWDSPLDVFEKTYEHEQAVTSLINDLVELADSEKDHATYNMLQWFVSEQVEEEDNVSNLIEKIKLMKDAPGGLFMLDKEFEARVFTPIASSEN